MLNEQIKQIPYEDSFYVPNWIYTYILIFKIIFIGILILLFSSCEKVIDFELGKAEPQIVIEATVNGTSQKAEVLLGLSGDYYNSSGFEKVTGAEIFLENDKGQSQMFIEESEGVYRKENISIDPGEICYLKIYANGLHYSAKSTMPEVVPIDSIYYQFSPETLFATEGYRAVVVFTDPPETGNYYRILLEVEGEMATNGVYYLFSDETGTQGKVNYILYKNSLITGSSFNIKLLSIDKATYSYYSELEKMSGDNPGPSQAAPANPDNNIQPEALGFFSARSESESETIFIQTK